MRSVCFFMLNTDTFSLFDIYGQREQHEMIYLNNTSGLQQVWIPRAMDFDDVSLVTLYLTHTATRTTYSDIVIKEWSVDGGYYLLTLALPEDMPVGEYEYSLDGEQDVPISAGLARIASVAQESAYSDSGVETIEFALYEE